VHYNCAKFHKTPISRLGGVALTRYTNPLFVKVYVELSPLLNFGQQPYSFALPADVHEGIWLLSKI
jgi:hypothetical protein